MRMRTRTEQASFSPAILLFLLLLPTLLWGIVPGTALANSDVYKVLPPDTRVLQYNLADIDGDAVKELAILYRAGGKTHMALFKAKSGRWFRWWDDDGTLELPDGSLPMGFETADVNGNGRAELLTYYLTGNNSSMTTRILALKEADTMDPAFEVILKDATSPPGYPILGIEGSWSSVTFLHMGTDRENGYRRVYCWNGKAFEKCEEVSWGKAEK